MKLTQLTAISPIDGRYGKTTELLSDYFSEYALIKYRVRVEVEYFIALFEFPLPQLKNTDKTIVQSFRTIYSDFSIDDAQRIKDIEATTNHDVKAVEYFLKEKMEYSFLNRNLLILLFNKQGLYSILSIINQFFFDPTCDSA